MFFASEMCTASACPDQLLPNSCVSLSSDDIMIVHGQGRGLASTMQARLHPEIDRATRFIRFPGQLYGVDLSTSHWPAYVV